MEAYHGTRAGALGVGDYLDPAFARWTEGQISVSLDRSSATYFADPNDGVVLTLEIEGEEGWEEGYEQHEIIITAPYVARVVAVESA